MQYLFLYYLFLLREIVLALNQRPQCPIDPSTAPGSHAPQIAEGQTTRLTQSALGIFPSKDNVQ